MSCQVLPAVCELLADETDAVKVGPHCELFILNLWLLCRGTLLCQCLLVQCKGENNVASNLACVKFAVEAPKLYRVVACEKGVQVKKVM